jgi:hypothetical protein
MLDIVTEFDLSTNQPFTAGVAEGAANQYRITATGTYANYYTNVFQSFIGYTVRVPDGRTGTILDTNRTISGNQVTAYSHLISLTGGAPGAGSYFITAPKSISSFYSGGAYVPAGTRGFPGGVSTVIPTSGPISLANFYGSTRFILQEYVFSAAGAGQVRSQDLPAGTWNILVNLQGAGGGGGGGPDGNNAEVGGVGAAAQMRFTISSATTQRITIYGANGGAGGSAGFGAGYNGGGGVAAAAFNPASFDPNVAAMFGGRDGGASGNIGASGGGGGGGGAVVIGWKPNINSGAYETLLGLAGGGGGGGGAGRYVYSSGPNSVGAGSWTVRGLTVELADFLLLRAQNSGWADGNGFPANKRAGYQNEGQGTYTMTAFYPPGDDGWANAWDGGAGGGGGGGNGFGGGLAGSANNTTIWNRPIGKDLSVGPWNPPYEGMGGGGGQGFIYADLNTYASFSVNYNSASQGLGVYGLGGALNGGAGTSGYIAVKITNLMSDRAFP